MAEHVGTVKVTLDLSRLNEQWDELRDGLARHMFNRQAETFSWEAEELDKAWENAGIRFFCMAEAQSVLSYVSHMANTPLSVVAPVEEAGLF